MNDTATRTPANNPTAQALELRDIHLPDAISWWPIAPGWWILLISFIVIISAFFIIKRIYVSKQLKRDINSELGLIKKNFQSLSNKPQLAKSLSVLLRRASISYYPKDDIAGLTGDDWLRHLDSTGHAANKIKFQSDTGRVLLSAPYLPGNSDVDFDSKALIQLCESWLLASHKTKRVQPA